MASTTHVWRGLDAPRLEIAHVDLAESGLSARGAQIGVQPGPYELRYSLEASAGFTAQRLVLELVGRGSLELELEDGQDHFDLGFAPLFNSLPILQHGLHRGGEPRDFVMAWVSVPDLVVSLSEQRYEPLRPGLIRYHGSHRPETPSFDLELDEEGFVTRYPGLAERIGRSETG